MINVLLYPKKKNVEALRSIKRNDGKTCKYEVLFLGTGGLFLHCVCEFSGTCSFFCWCKPDVYTQKELCHAPKGLQYNNRMANSQWRLCNNASMSNSNAELAAFDVTDIIMLLVVKKKK